jgi:hypothetical protein
MVDTQRVRRSVLLGGAGSDGHLDGATGPTSTWREAIALAKVEPTGIGLDFLAEPEPLIAAAASLGVDEVLLRLEWARICPARNFISTEALAMYAGIVEQFRARGVSVGVVLSDGTTPEWMGAEAWLMPATPRHFETYTSAVMDRLGVALDCVITLEEPGTWVTAAWVLGAAPPFRFGGLRDAIAALDAMSAAHERAARLIEAEYDGIEVGVLASQGRAAAFECQLFIPGGTNDQAAQAMVRRWGTGQAHRQRLDRESTSTADLIAAAGEIRVPCGPLGRSMAVRLLSGSGRERDLDPIRSLRFSAVVAQIDSRGRRTLVRSRQRLDDLLDLVARSATAQTTAVPRRIILGEVVDRWRWGSTAGREGIFGVDRLRGAHGFQILSTDATGLDVAGPLRAALGGTPR